ILPLLPRPAAAVVVCSDPTALDTARAQIAASCDCAGASKHRPYVRCAAKTVRALVATQVVSAGCAVAARQCAGRSTCGLSSAVVGIKGSTCRREPDENACAVISGSVGACSSCCDARTAGSCPAVAATKKGGKGSTTTTTSTTSTTRPTTTTTRPTTTTTRP